MEVRYHNNKIEKVCESFNEAKKKYNKDVAEKLMFTIQYLKNAETLKDVFDMLSFHLHELKGNRKGQWAIDLGRRIGYRMIIEVVNGEQNKNIIKFYESVRIVEVMEVSNHYE